MKRFWDKVAKAGPDECWPWIGGTSNGYGYLYFEDRVQPAHRVVLMLLGHELPAGGDVHHRCRNRSCVNPAHLESTASRAEHAGHHLRDCSKHGAAEMTRIRTGRNVGTRYCNACNREKARARRARA